MKTRIIAKIAPTAVKIIPRLKGLDLGLNIQKLEITKKNNDTPKKTLSGDKGFLDSDL